jgi:HlyD family secretion protein
MTKKWKIVLAVIGLLIVAFVTMGVVKRKQANVTEVTIAKVGREDLVSKVTANGKIEAKRKVDMSANIMGQIVNLAVREGDHVKKGDFLMQIDRAQHAASVSGAAASLDALFHDRDSARASAQEAALAYERARKSYDEKLIPLADLERAKAQLDSSRANVASTEGRIQQARAALTGAQDTLQKATMRAPMDGIVTRLPVEQGEVAVIGTMNNPGTVLMTISDMSIVEATMDVDETDIPNVKVGQNAKVTIDAYPNKTYDAVVTEVGSSPRSATAGATEAVNFEVKLQLKNPPPDVRPGFSASADIITGTRNQAVAIPLQALVVRDAKGAKKPGAATNEPKQEEEGVYTFDTTSSLVKFVPVKTGISGETSVEIVNGINAGAEIVTGPFKALREIEDGKKVRIAKEKKGDKDGKGEEKKAES